MHALLKHPAWAIWLLLMAATGLSWWLSGDGGSDNRTAATIGLMVVAFIKIRFVGIHFMELGHAPVALRFIFEGWVIVVCAMIIGVYLGG
ncbi:MAG: cytochrome C oxidase subunit IV family protein [Panacagrimonas sp.]